MISFSSDFRAQRLVAVLCMLALTLVPILPRPALATSASEHAAATGVLTVSDSVADAYEAYQLFGAKVADGDGSGGKLATNVAWASDTVREAVLPVLHEAGMETTDAAAQDGYWLVVAEEGAVGESQAGTAPIFTLVGGAPVTAEPKAAVPAVRKHVLEDSDDIWRKAADATVGDNLYWRLSATIPAGLVGYDAYTIEFADTMSAGLDPAKVVSSARLRGSRCRRQLRCSRRRRRLYRHRARGRVERHHRQVRRRS